MKLAIPFLALALVLPTSAEIKRQDRKSLLDSEPGVIYLERILGKPLELQVVKEAPVFSDTEGKHRLGTLAANQTVKLEAVTDKIYRVRGQGTHSGIAGWVAPWAFSSKDPQFVARLKEFYDRQIEVQAFIDAKQVAVGMTLDEVSQARGKPTKTSIRKAEKGETGRWEYIDYEQVKHYITRVDPSTGQVYRQLSHIEQVEKGRTSVEFGDGIVTAVEESEDHQGGSVRIVVPPLVFGW
jgi:hypothetical protein